MPLAADSR